MPAATRLTSSLSAAALILLSAVSVCTAAELPDQATLRQWVEEMKTGLASRRPPK